MEKYYLHRTALCSQVNLYEINFLPVAIPSYLDSNWTLRKWILTNSLSAAKSTGQVKLKVKGWTSLVAQWLRIRLSMQGTRVQYLARKIPHAAEQLSPCAWAWALEPTCHNYWAHVLQLLKPARLEPMLCNEKPPQWEACAPQRKVAPAHRN